jgi:hypothetical protein
MFHDKMRAEADEQDRARHCPGNGCFLRYRAGDGTSAAALEQTMTSPLSNVGSGVRYIEAPNLSINVGELLLPIETWAPGAACRSFSSTIGARCWTISIHR